MNNYANELQTLLSKLLSVSQSSFSTPYAVLSRARHEIIFNITHTPVGYISFKHDYQDYLPVLNSSGTYVSLDLDYSEGYTLYSLLTGLNRTLQSIHLNPAMEVNGYRLWILRYGNHYVVIEMNYDKLREAVREHHFQTTFKLGEPYETYPRSRYGEQ